MAAPTRSTDLRAIVEPILNKVSDGIYEQRADEYKQVFKEEDGIKRSYHEEPELFGFNMAPELPDGMPVTYQQGGVLFTQRYPYKQYGLAFALTKILVEDGEHINVGKTFTEHLMQALIETEETIAANVLNRAFNSSYLGGDGVSLSNSAHPVYGNTYSNVLATPAALSQTSLEQALIQVRQAIGNNGQKIRLKPKQIVAAPGNMFQAEVLLKSVLRAGTNNNDINPVKSIGELSDKAAILSRLTSSTAWWVQTDAPNGLKALWRRRIGEGGGMEGDFETDSMRYKRTFRGAWGWTNSRTLYGTAGA